MKKKKVNLSQLKVDSFITAYDEQSSETMKGGYQDVTNGNVCNTAGSFCHTDLLTLGNCSWRCSGVGC